MDSLTACLNKKVVLDLSSAYVCLGKLIRIEPQHYVMEDADLHDLRDSPTTRENYIVFARTSGIKANRKQVLIRAQEVVAVSLFEHVIDAESEEE